jgi:hypothetical protein
MLNLQRAAMHFRHNACVFGLFGYATLETACHPPLRVSGPSGSEGTKLPGRKPDDASLFLGTRWCARADALFYTPDQPPAEEPSETRIRSATWANRHAPATKGPDRPQQDQQCRKSKCLMKDQGQWRTFAGLGMVNGVVFTAGKAWRLSAGLTILTPAYFGAIYGIFVRRFRSHQLLHIADSLLLCGPTHQVIDRGSVEDTRDNKRGDSGHNPAATFLLHVWASHSRFRLVMRVLGRYRKMPEFALSRRQHGLESDVDVAEIGDLRHRL